MRVSTRDGFPDLRDQRRCLIRLRKEPAVVGQILKAAGVKTTHLTYKGVTHEFFGLDAVVVDAKTAQDAAARDLKAAFAVPTR